jgi:membrane protein
MAIKEQHLDSIEKKIHLSNAKEARSVRRSGRLFHRIITRAWMLYHEIVRDDLMIRAQSLSYFTLFSILPMLAGIFLMLGFFAQWGPVQQQFEDYLGKLLEPIPPEHRQFLLTFMMQFKETYVANLTKKSSSIGVFALVILVWLVVQVFINIEDLLNRIWVVNENRSLIDRLQNFIFCVVILPLIWITALSLPSMVSHFTGNRLGGLVEQGVPTLIMVLGLTFLFKYVPNAQVAYKNAFKGALFSTVIFSITSSVLRIYFRFGTETSYGKAAVLPIVAFFIYVMWLIVIIGAEVSFIAQNKYYFIGRILPVSTLGEAAVMTEMLQYMQKNFDEGRKPQSPNEMADHFKVPVGVIIRILQYLLAQNIVAEILVKKRSANTTYLLNISLKALDLPRLMRDFLKISDLERNFDVHTLINSIRVK